MSSYKPARVLWNLGGAGPGTTLSGAATTSSPVISLGDISDVWLAVNVQGTPTGTTPTLDVGLDVQDIDGNWFPLAAKIVQLTTAAGRGSGRTGSRGARGRRPPLRARNAAHDRGRSAGTRYPPALQAATRGSLGVRARRRAHRLPGGHIAS